MSAEYPFPPNHYRIIYADPPWSYRSCGTTLASRGTARKHYETMPVDEICQLPVGDICTADAICFLWATAPTLPDALQVMAAWGFQYKTIGFTWVKKYPSGSNFVGMGAYTRANAELCLIGVRAGFRPHSMILRHDVRQIIEAPVEAHSKKPDIVRERIVELLGDIPRIELFARQRVVGWDAWGNEVLDENRNGVVSCHI